MRGVIHLGARSEELRRGKSYAPGGVIQLGGWWEELQSGKSYTVKGVRH